MATITTKYSIGDTVYSAGTVVTRKQRPCPDCLGSRRWRAVSPAGADYEFACPRCSVSYQSNDALSLTYSAHVPSVQRLTIGQVLTETGGQSRVVYMCEETGVGSGTLWNEEMLHPTEAEAMVASEGLAKVRDEEVPWVKKLFDQSLKVCDYELSNAVKKAAEDADISRRVRVQMLFEDIRDCQNNDEIKEALERYSERVKEAA